jgi:hypothetical protein
MQMFGRRGKSGFSDWSNLETSSFLYRELYLTIYRSTN